MVWGFSASGLRTVISLEGYYDKALANILTIDLNSIGINLVIPTGTLLFFVLLAVLMWAFLHTKTGTAMTAVGSNPAFARAAGINVDKNAAYLRDHVHLAGRCWVFWCMSRASASYSCTTAPSGWPCPPWPPS